MRHLAPLGQRGAAGVKGPVFDLDPRFGEPFGKALEPFARAVVEGMGSLFNTKMVEDYSSLFNSTNYRNANIWGRWI